MLTWLASARLQDEVVLTYTTKDSAKTSIASVKANAIPQRLSTTLART